MRHPHTQLWRCTSSAENADFESHFNTRRDLLDLHVQVAKLGHIIVLDTRAGRALKDWIQLWGATTFAGKLSSSRKRSELLGSMWILRILRASWVSAPNLGHPVNGVWISDTLWDSLWNWPNHILFSFEFLGPFNSKAFQSNYLELFQFARFYSY